MLPLLLSPCFAADFDWMEGTWRGQDGAVVYEEAWRPALGGARVGTFRLAEGEQVVFYELMTLSATELRIRHFDGELSAWEPKKRPLRFTVTEAGEGRAVFTAVGEATRLVYVRQGDTLEVSLEKAGKTHTFRFARE